MKPNLRSLPRPHLSDIPLPVPPRPGVQLQPIPWGKPDPKLARIVLRNIVDTTPPTIVPFNPRIEARIRSDLRKARVDHF
jgi:hypothetical protein